MTELRDPNLTVRSGSGTAFPTSPAPASGDLFWRTDLSLQFFYDGTRWLTTTLYDVPFGPGDVLGGTTLSGAAMGRFSLPTALDAWIEKWRITTFVLTTNNATNYWTMTLQKINAANTPTTMDSFTTAADAASTWISRNRTQGVSLSSGSFPLVQVTDTKTLTPGGLYFATNLQYRLIGT